MARTRSDGRLRSPDLLRGRKPLRDVSRPSFAHRLDVWMGRVTLFVVLLCCPLSVAAFRSNYGRVGVLLVLVLGAREGVVGLRRVRWRYRRRQGSRPGLSGGRPAPWQRATRWTAEGVKSGRGGTLHRPLIAVSVALVVVGWFQLEPTDAGFAVLVTPSTVWFALRALRVWAAGWTRLAFLRFPYVVDEPLRFRFDVSERGASFASLDFELRRIEDRSTPGRWDGPLYVVYRQSRRMGDAYAPEPGGGVEVEFRPAPDERGTREGGTRRTFWEVVARGDTSAGRFEQVFPVPVYDAHQVARYVRRGSDAPEDS